MNKFIIECKYKLYLLKGYILGYKCTLTPAQKNTAHNIRLGLAYKEGKLTDKERLTLKCINFCLQHSKEV